MSFPKHLDHFNRLRTALAEYEQLFIEPRPSVVGAEYAERVVKADQELAAALTASYLDFALPK